MAHVDNLRKYFPAVRHVTYLNTGTFGPLPDKAIEAMQENLARQLKEGRIGTDYYPHLQDVRRQVREQLGALFSTSADNFVLTENTTQGMNVALWGLPLQPGDEIIYTDAEHQDGLLPIYIQKQRRGVVLKCVNGSLPAEELLAALKQACTNRTRVIITSHLSYQTGHRFPLERIARLAHDAGAYFLVDGAQGAGAEELNLNDVPIDIYAIPGEKWLCGPDGTGALYVHPALLPVLQPTYAGAATLADSHLYDFTGGFLAAPDARRYEHSATSLANWIGWLESLKFLRGMVGWDYAFSRIKGLSGHLFEQLLDITGAQIVTPRDARAGLLSFRMATHTSAQVVQAARERGIDLRLIPERNLVRVSCGFYNNQEDLQRVISLLQSM